MQLGKPGAEVTKKLLGLHGKCRKPQLRKVVGARKIFLKFLPRNNKLSQVTVHLFLGPKQAAVSYFHKSYKPKGLPNERTLVIIHFFRVGYNWLLVKQSNGALHASGLDTAQEKG